MADPIDPVDELAVVRASRDHTVCLACHGMPEAVAGGMCRECNGTGRRRILIPLRDGTYDCICMLSRLARPIAGIPALCPVCLGERQISSERMREIYPTLLRHQAEFTHDAEDTQVIRRPLAVVLATNGYGAYTEAHPEIRLYVEPSGEKGKYDLFTQDMLRPLGDTARIHMSHAKPLSDLFRRVKKFPSPDEAIWLALPGQCALRLWEAHA